MKSILITGCAGFIGSVLAKHLLKYDYFIYGIDDLSKGTIKNLPKSKKFIFLKGKCEEPKILSKIKKKIDVIFHAAGQASGELSYYDPQNDLNRNLLTTVKLLEFYKKKKCKQFIYFSSMGVYGNKIGQVSETTDCKPISFYGLSKLVSEKYIIKYSEQNINYTILRLFNVYGEGQKLTSLTQGMIRIYLKQIFSTNKLIIKGSGKRFRDFVYIKDVVSIMRKLILNKSTYNQTLNLGYGKKYTVSQLVGFLKSKIKKNFKVKYINNTPSDQFGIYSNNKKIKKILKYKFKYNLKKGLDLFIKSVS
jgi:UDP-glucose 4-epimerase